MAEGEFTALIVFARIPPRTMKATSLRAALIYLHATRERDQNFAAGMGKLFADAKKTLGGQPG